MTKNIWIWLDPPLFYNQISKIVSAQKVHQAFGLARNPAPPPFMENTQIKAAFFSWHPLYNALMT